MGITTEAEVRSPRIDGLLAYASACCVGTACCLPLTHSASPGLVVTSGAFCVLSAAAARMAWKAALADAIAVIAMMLLLRLPTAALYEDHSGSPWIARLGQALLISGWESWSRQGSISIDAADGSLSVT